MNDLWRVGETLREPQLQQLLHISIEPNLSGCVAAIYH
jgi:hypothetical protein